MTVVLEGTGGLFDRIGAIYRWIEQNRLTVSGTGTAGRWPYELNDVFYKYQGASNAVQATTDDLQRAALNSRSIVEQLNASLAFAAQNTLIEMVDADATLPVLDVASAIAELLRQMDDNSESIAANTVGVTVTPGSSNVGNGILITDDLDKYGRQLENALAETIELTRESSSQAFTARGEAAASSKLSTNWPLGSGANKRISVIDAAQSQGYLVDGGFENFTANAPDSWPIVVGSAGTDIKEEATEVFTGAKALEFDGDAATLSQVRQAITGNVSSRTPFFVGVFCKVDVVPAAGSLIIDLHDGTSVIQDDAGNNQSLTIDVTALTTSWAGFGALFRIADPKPAVVYLRVRLATAVSSGSSLFIDNLTANTADQIYGGGPYAGLVAGSLPFAIDDTLEIGVTNNRASLYQEAFDVLFDMTSKGLIVPTDGSPTITNSYPAYEGS